MTAPGWYPDPQDQRMLRWWDGSQWTSHTNPNVQQPAASQPVSTEQAPFARAVQPLEAAQTDLNDLRQEYARLKGLVVETSDLALLQEIGVYHYRHRLQDAAAYKELRIAITQAYHDLRVEELQLTADFLQKQEEEKQERKERLRQERERRADEEQARLEIEREQERCEKERAHYENLLVAARANADRAAIEKAEAKIKEIDDATDDLEKRAANTRAGWVYVISNIGAFGEGVVKIGLTRRLDPTERIHELGGASVPFRFDIHGFLFSDDAVGLEDDLHEAFAHRRVNKVNERREFFRATRALGTVVKIERCTRHVGRGDMVRMSTLWTVRIPAGLQINDEQVPPATAGTRSAAASRTLKLPSTTPLEMEWADGTRIIQRPEDFPGAQGGESREVDFSRAMARGVLPSGLVRLVAHQAGQVAVSEMLRRADARSSGTDFDGKDKARLVRIDERVPASIERTAKSVLVLVHGTFSRTEEAFGGLLASHSSANAADASYTWSALSRVYGSCYGFDHRTLSETPLTNALHLAKALHAVPEGSQIDFLTHSRGGLVADVFAAAAATASGSDELGSNSHAFASFAGDFTHLRSLIAARGLKVRRTVRVAAPARGTTLAGPRLGTWLNVLLNVAGLATGASASSLYQGIKEFLIAIVAEGRSYDAVPGVACMRPDDMFVRWLSTMPAAGSLTAIAGDASRPGFLARLRTLLPDLFFQQRNDFVVDTAAMFGGPGYVAGLTELDFRDEPGASVNHFAYFKNRPVLDSITSALADWRPPAPAQTRGRRDTSKTVADAFGAEPLSASSSLTGADTVIVIPGIMGSALSGPNGPLWMRMAALVEGRFKELADLTPYNIEAKGLLLGPYQRLVEDLRRTYSVVPFPFDWRVSIEASAKRLNDRIVNEVLPNANGCHVHLLAHSMGGLVARALAAYHPQTWSRLQRVVMLGTPLRGSWTIVDLLLGRDPTLRRLALIDLMHNAPQLLSWIRTFPGVLEMLPEATDRSQLGGPLHDKAWVGRLGLDEKAWQAAQRVRARLAEQKLDPKKVHYVAGTAKETLAAIETDEKDVSLVRTWVTPEGDGRVTWGSIYQDLQQMWVMPAVHGDLADTKPSFPALQQLLSRGETRDLTLRPTPESVVTRKRRSARRDGEDTETFDALEPVLMPREDELEDALLGRTRTTVTQQLVVEVVHGDLAAEDGVVVVGHEAGADLRGAEPSLDLAFRGRLTERLRARRYPHARGECAVVPYEGLSPGQRKASDGRDVPEAILVVGLGPSEALSRTHVTEALQTAIVELSLPPFSQLLSDGPLETLSLSLVGHREDKLTVEESVGACLDAVLFANRQMAHGIRRVRLVDLYADKAAEALRAAAAYAKQPGIEMDGSYERIEVPLEVTMLTGAEQWLGTRPVRRYAAGQLRRINIRSHRCEGRTSIECGVAGEGSSFGRYELPVRWEVIEDHCGVLHTGPLSGESVRALRALVLPEPLHGDFTSGVDLHLVVDQETASIPWEAFVDAGVRTDAPLTTAISIVRQLSDVSTQVRTRSRGAGKALVMCPELEQAYRLPGAEAEAVEVATMLRNAGYNVRMARGVPQELRAALADAYEIVHVSGHGQQKPKDPGQTGVLMMGNDVLSQFDFGYFKSEPPSLVFLSCCHLGQIETTEGSGSSWASGLARALVSSGVPTVVAAGWAIDDGAALGFAKGFYASVLSGDRLRSSAAKARIAAKEAGGLSTWAAYQVYGNPDFVLPTTRGTAGRLDLELESALRRAPIAAYEARNLLAEVLRRANLSREEIPLRLQAATEDFLARLPSWARTRDVEELSAMVLDTFPKRERPKQSNVSPPQGTAAEIANLKAELSSDRSTKQRSPDRATYFAVNLLSRYCEEANKPDRNLFAANLVNAWRTAFKGGGRPDDFKKAQRLITLVLNVLRPLPPNAAMPAGAPSEAFQALITALQADFPELLNDSQAGKFGFVPSNGVFTLNATVQEPDDDDMYTVKLTVTWLPGYPAPAAVKFYLDQSFGDAPFFAARGEGQNVIEMTTYAYGPFTVGAEVLASDSTGRPSTPTVDMQSVRLELDLQTLPSAPRSFLDAF